MADMIRVDPDKVIEKLTQQNSVLNRTNVMLEIAYEELSESLSIANRQLEELKAQNQAPSKA